MLVGNSPHALLMMEVVGSANASRVAAVRAMAWALVLVLVLVAFRCQPIAVVEAPSLIQW